MTKTHFISDTHFGHANIIRLANRPFKDVETMDQALICSWNRAVLPYEHVWFLGDFSWYNEKATEGIFDRLNGVKHLIVGNHDFNSMNLEWASVHDSHILSVSGKKVHLFHYPIEEWDGFYRGTLHFHGHVHGKKLSPIKGRLDLGVENINYAPIDFSEAVKKACE